MRGVLTKDTYSSSQAHSAAPLEKKGSRSGRLLACLVSKCAVQVDAKHAQRKRKRVCAEVCLREGSSDQSYWVSCYSLL